MKRKLILWALLACFLCALLFISYRYFNMNGLSRFGGDGGGNRSYEDLLSKKEREWLKSRGSLIYGADRNAPPLRFVDKVDNQYKGVVVDYVNSLSLELGIEIKLQPFQWEDALKNLSEAETDICDMFKSEERAKYYNFTKPFYSLRAVLAVRSEDGSANGLEALEGKTVATQKGDYVNEYIDKYYPNIKHRYVADVYEALNLLVEGKVEAVAGDEPVVLYQLDKNGFKNSVRVVDPPLYENEVVFAVPKSRPELIPILNKGIDSLKQKGDLEKIQQKWFGISTPIVKSPDIGKLKNYIAAFVSVGVLALLLMALWNQSLKKLVDTRTKELEDSRNDLQTVFDGITEYMIVVNREKRIVNVNNPFLKYAGKNKADMISRPCPGYLQGFCGSCEACIVAKTFETANNSEAEVHCGNEIYEMHTYPLKDTSGYVKNVLVILMNATAEKISKYQILQANKMIAIGQLAAGIAHEIRNPLGIIRNHSFILRTSECNRSIIEKSLDYIDTAVTRASKIIDNLLNFSRISGNSQEWVAMRAFISNITDLEHKYLTKHNLRFDVECTEGLRCLINQESLKHILINLVSNAVDATDDYGKLTIRAYPYAGAPDTGGLVIECADSGHGIRKEDLEKIFNPFYTTKEPRKGTGLGLYIVYSEVKKLNGDIKVESEVNVGTTFRIFLPVETEVDTL